jgi:DNA-directed RNA polymerase specialized sigma24 family protein
VKNYTDSDYALNKYNGGIVYRFTVTLAGYLAENPDKTESDFAALKEISDAIYLDQVRAENAQTKKNVSIHNLEDGDHFGGVTLEDEFLDAFDREAAAKAFAKLIKDEALTETQERRFRLRVLDGLTFREIAELEGVVVRAVQKSVDAALRLFIEKFNKTF